MSPHNGDSGYTNEDSILPGYGYVSNPRRTESSAAFLKKCQNIRYTSVFLLLLMTLVRKVCEREFLFQLGEFSRKAGMKFQKSLPAQFWLWLD